MKIRIVSYNPFSKLIIFSCNKTIEIASEFIPFQRMLQKHTYCFHQLQLQEFLFHLSSIVQQMVLGLQKMPFLSCFAVQDLNRNASRPCLVSLVDLNIRNLISMVSYWFLELVDTLSLRSVIYTKFPPTTLTLYFQNYFCFILFAFFLNISISLMLNLTS